MNAGQYEGIIGRLDAILGKMPAAPVAEPDNASARGRISDQARMVGRTEALEAVLRAIDGWIQGSRENHFAMDHRNENTGEECWRSFSPSDFRNMVDDAARELGVTQFPAPTHPEEDA